MERKRMFENIEPNACPYCNVPSLFFNKNKYGVIEKMQCRRCLREFYINWTGSKPRPIYNYKLLLTTQLKNNYL